MQSTREEKAAQRELWRPSEGSPLAFNKILSNIYIYKESAQCQGKSHKKRLKATIPGAQAGPGIVSIPTRQT